MSSVICLVGPSGVGKTSYANRLIKDFGFEKPIVVTTREARADDDRNYTYVSESEFLEMCKDSEFIEWDGYNRYYYGTLRESVLRIIQPPSLGRCVLDLTPKGCRQVRVEMPEAKIVALLPDDLSWLKKRLRERGTDTAGSIEERTALLDVFVAEVRDLSCDVIYCNYAPETWGPTFEKMVALLDLQKEG